MTCAFCAGTRGCDRASAVDYGDRVDLDQVSGLGQGFDPYQGVGWLVIAEHAGASLLDHGQVLGPVMYYVDGDLGDLPSVGAGGREGAAEVGEYLPGLGGQVSGTDQVAVSVFGFLAGDEYRLAPGRDDDVGVGGRGLAGPRG